MEKAEQVRIQSEILKISDRVKTHGRHSERVKINLDIIMQGQDAINYKVTKLFSPEVTDSQLAELIFLLGIKNGTEIIKLLASEQGIQI